MFKDYECRCGVPLVIPKRVLDKGGKVKCKRCPREVRFEKKGNGKTVRKL